MTHLRERLLGGEEIRGAMIFEFFTPGVAQLLTLAGCEYVIYDMEHAGTHHETLKAQAAFCRGLPVVPMCRVPSSDYHHIARALDIGMRGVMVPMVDSAEEAAKIAEATRYPPTGRRGAAFGFAHDGYAPGAPADKMAKADAETVVIAQIETERGLAEVDAIAATPGIDVLWVGHFDLTNFLGVPGDFQSPIYQEALAEIVAAGRKHGKALGILGRDAATLKDYRDRGFTMLAAGTDQAILVDGLKAAFQGSGA